MENIEIAKIFHVIAELPENLKSIVENDEPILDEISGIGKSIHEKIVEIVKTGKCKFHDELLKELPPTILELLQVSGMGEKTEENILKAIENLKQSKGRFKLGIAMTYAVPLIEYLKNIDGVIHV